MALRIPDTRETLPAQQAFTQADPSTQFGQVKEQVQGMPDVPNQYAGRSLVDGSDAYAGMQSIAAGFDSIAASLNNVEARDKALKTAQEDQLFKGDQLDAEQKLYDAERMIEEKAVAEGWTVDQKKAEMTYRRGEVLAASLDPDKYEDADIKNNAKFAFKQLDMRHNENYIRTVIEPERVAAIEGGIIRTVDYIQNLAVQSKSPQELQQYHNQITELTNTPGFQALSPSKREQIRMNAHMGVEKGMVNHILNTLPTDNVAKAQAMIDTWIKDPTALPTLDVGDREQAIAGGNRAVEGIKRDIEVKRRQAQADAEKRQRDWQNNNQYDLMLKIRNGQASETEVVKAMNSGRIGKADAVQLLNHVDSRNEKYAKEHEAFNTVNALVANGIKVTDQKLVDKWYESTKKETATMPAGQRGKMLIENFSKIGGLPSEYKNETLGMLNSDDPAKYQKGVNRLRYINSIDPRLVQSFDKPTRLIIDQSDTGMPVTQLMKNRDNAARISVSEYEQREKEYTSRLNKADTAGKTPTIKHLEKEFEGVISDKMRGVFEESVKQNYLGGMDQKHALSIAVQDFKTRWGTSEIGGTARVMEHPPEQAYNQRPEVIQRQLDRDTAALGLKNTNVQLKYGGEDKNRKPFYLVLKTDEATGMAERVLGPNNMPVKWQFDPMQDPDLLAQQAEQKKEYDLAQKEFTEKNGKRIEIDSSSKHVKKYPNK